MKHKGLLLLCGVLVIGLMTGCAGPNTMKNVSSASGDIAGFWSGLLHGFFAFPAFFVSLFSDTITIYEVHNNGGWYNFGFVLGA